MAKTDDNFTLEKMKGALNAQEQADKDKEVKNFRDYIATEVLLKLIDRGHYSEGHPPGCFDKCAGTAYKMADAMIKEREKTND